MKLKKFLTPFVAAAILMSTVLIVNAAEAETAAEAADEAIAASASVTAAGDGIGSDTFRSEKVYAYTSTGSFTVTATRATAEMSMSEGSGPLTLHPSCSLDGYVTLYSGKTVYLQASGEMSCDASATYNSSPTKSSCTFTMLNKTAATIMFP